MAAGLTLKSGDQSGMLIVWFDYMDNWQDNHVIYISTEMLLLYTY